MLRPGHPELLDHQPLDDLGKLVLLEIRRRRVAPRLLALVGEVDAAARLEVEIEHVDVLELHPCALAEEVFDQLVHRDRGLAAPVGHGRDTEGDRAAVVHLLVVADGVVSLLGVRQRAHLEGLHRVCCSIFCSSASVFAAWPFW